MKCPLATVAAISLLCMATLTSAVSAASYAVAEKEGAPIFPATTILEWIGLCKVLE